MNGPGDIPLTVSSTPDLQSCSLISTIGMASCRGRAEAFARRLSSKLRTLGSQNDEDPISPEDEPIINGGVANTWLPAQDSERTVTDLQPLRHESDSFFDFDCELESPGSPVDECEYLRLIETASNTPHNSAPESGYVCASAASSHSSTDGAYFDAINADSAAAIRTKLSVSELPDYVNSLKMNGSKEHMCNGFDDQQTDDASEEQEQHDDQLATGDDQLDCQTTDLKKELPITGPDESKTTTIEDSPVHEMSTVEMIEMQKEIISELQKQSAEVADNESQKCGSLEQEPEEILTAIITAIESSESADELLHKISNGPTENANENEIEQEEEEEQRQQSKDLEGRELVLKIDLTEIEKKLKETATTENEDSTEKNDTDILSPDIDDDAERKRLSTLDTTDDEDDCRPQRVRRCSSLKTGKTPPGTPGRKKIVRFADVLGLDLADVKTFLDEIPTIPKSAFEDLEILESEPPIQLGPKSDKMLMPLFQQPGGLATFLDIVREKQVSLENAAVTDTINQTITGTVRVRNLDFHKSVHIRYSLDGWRSFADLQCNYAENSCDGFSDKFTFVIFGNTLQVGQRLEFAVRFQCKGQQFWDSNYNANYCFQCLPTSNPATHSIQPIVATHHTNHLMSMLSPTVADTWCSSFY